MNNRVTLTVVSLVAIVLLTLHMTDDFIHHGGTTPIGFAFVTAVIATWLYAVLTLAGRRWGYIISGIGSLLGLVVVAVHIFSHSMIDATAVGTSDPYFFILTLLALGVTSLYSFSLALRGIIGKL